MPHPMSQGRPWLRGARSVVLAGMLAGVLAAALAGLLAPPVHAQEYEPLPPELEARKWALYDSIRCPQCAGQNIGQSAAPIAKAMRATVDERLRAGEGDEEIIAFLVGSFGEEILASPPKRGVALLVWLIPPIALVLGGGTVAFAIRRLRRGGGQDTDPYAAQGQGPLAAPGSAGNEATGDLAPYLEMVDREMGGGGREPS